MEDYTLFEYIPTEILQAILERMAMSSLKEIEKVVPSLASHVAEVRRRRLGNSSSIAVLEAVYIELESAGRSDLYLPYIRNRPILQTRELGMLLLKLGSYYLPHTARYVCQHSDLKYWRSTSFDSDVDDEWIRNVIKLDITDKTLQKVLGQERYCRMYPDIRVRR